MVNMLHRKKRWLWTIVSKLEISIADKEHGKPSKKYEDVELQALLDEDDSQIQKQLAEQLSVSQQAVSNRLREMGKIQKVDSWVPHERETDGEAQKHMWNFARTIQKKVILASYRYWRWKVFF